MAIPLLEGCDIAGKDITGDALLTQRALATYLVEQQAHYHFSVKGNQPTLERDIRLLFEKRDAADFVAVSACEHGRIETRSIWCSTALNAWNSAWGKQDKAMALDGKTMKNAIDEAGQQAHIMSVVGHESKICHAQKKSAPYP